MNSNNMKMNTSFRMTELVRSFCVLFLLFAVNNYGYADTKNVRHVRTIKTSYDINWIAWHPNGEEFVGGGNFNKAVTIWNARTGEVVRKIVGDDGGVASVAYSPDGRYLAVGRGFTRITREHVHLSIYDAKTGATVQRFVPQTSPPGTSNDVYAVTFSPDGHYVVASSYVGHAGVVYEVQTGKVVTVLPAGEGTYTINTLAYSPDGKYVIVGKTTGVTIPQKMLIGMIDVVSTADWSLVKTIKVNSTGVDSLSYCGSSRYLVSGSLAVERHFDKVLNKEVDKYPAPIKIWDTASFTTVAELSSDLVGSMRSIGCMPDGKTLFAGGGAKSVEIWDVQSGHRLEWLKGFGSNAFIQPSPDGKNFAVSAKKKIEIWELIR